MQFANNLVEYLNILKILKKYEINSNKILAVVEIFHCLHLEVFTD